MRRAVWACGRYGFEARARMATDSRAFLGRKAEDSARRTSCTKSREAGSAGRVDGACGKDEGVEAALAGGGVPDEDKTGGNSTVRARTDGGAGTIGSTSAARRDEGHGDGRRANSSSGRKASRRAGNGAGVRMDEDDDVPKGRERLGERVAHGRGEGNKAAGEGEHEVRGNERAWDDESGAHAGEGTDEARDGTGNERDGGTNGEAREYSQGQHIKKVGSPVV
ncbi:hypothetical protein B0H14DRAFT_2620418 [Mycena olivaceomarginata]|nr:hypothetical protein B0H14DRAFT_2620418 [Mycena olivaceomarginata]